MKKLSFIAIALSLFISCTKEIESPIVYQEKTTTTGVNPFTMEGINRGGNINCNQVANIVAIPEFTYTTGRQNYPFSPNAFPSEVSVTTDGTYVSWSITPPSGLCVSTVAVIVKGGPRANVYFYKTGQSNDSGLHAPISVFNGNPFGLGNLTICYNFIPGCE